jgi:hypothetical protein
MSIGPTPPSGVTPPIRKAWADVYARWGAQVSNLGTFACRRIFGRPAPAPWSEHAWGNAWDIGGSTAVLSAVARYLAQQPYAAQVLWQGRDLVTGASVEDHYNHVHISGRPLRNPNGTAVPPCAGGVGAAVGAAVAPPMPLPAPAATVAGESWAPVARVAARELVDIADRIGRAAGALRDTIAGR